MAKKKIIATKSFDIPEDVRDHSFYGLRLDSHQADFVNAMFNKGNIGVFCNARAGTGKTLLSVAAAKYLVDCGRFDKAFYIIAPVCKDKIGFLPGTVRDKIAPAAEPLLDALAELGEQPIDLFDEDSSYWITAKSHDFDRGRNYKNSVIIIDEAQNFYMDELKKELTRIHDNCLCVVIGHSEQCDLLHNPERSGFTKYLDKAKEESFVQVCNLEINYRGKFSQWADDVK